MASAQSEAGISMINPVLLATVRAETPRSSKRPAEVRAGGDGQHREAQGRRRRRAHESGLRYAAAAASSRKPTPSSLPRAPAWHKPRPSTRCGCAAENSIADRNGEIAKENAELQPAVAAARPARRHQRAYQRSQAASTEQDAHAEHGSARSIDAAPVHRKLARAHHREDHPAGPDHQFAGLGKHRGKQRADDCARSECPSSTGEKSTRSRGRSGSAQIPRAARRNAFRQSESPTPGTTAHSG